MKKKLIFLGALALLSTVAAYAYNSGYCCKAGCYCHQYYGGSAGQDRCTTCGHAKAAHS